MSVDRNNRAHRPGGLPQGYAGTFADGAYAALFDGRELTTVRIDGPDIQDVGFRPESIRA